MAHVLILKDGDADMAPNGKMDGSYYHVYAGEQLIKLGDAEDRKSRTFGCLVETPFGPAYVTTDNYEDIYDL